MMRNRALRCSNMQYVLFMRIYHDDSIHFYKQLIFALTIEDSLPGDDDDGDDTSDISTCAVEAIHDVVAEIRRK